MTTKNKGYQIIPFPPLRQLIADAGRFAQGKHTIRGLLEIDVSRVRRFIRQHKEQTGETLSLTAFLIACLARAVGANKNLHAYRSWRNQLIIFDDVDVMTYLEVELDGQKFPLAHIVRAANRKTWRGIHEEIRSVQANPEQSPKARQWSAVRFLLLLPAFVRDIFYRFINRRPHLWKKHAGTVNLTSVGMFGTGGGWGIAYSSHTLSLIIGGLSEQPVVRAGHIEIRECLNVTADFDHDLIDGAPAARLIEEFKQLIENGFDCAAESKI